MKIMVIDDEPIVAKALRKLICWEQHGFRWLPEAYDGQAALKQILQEKPDLLLLDCRMPGMNGLELLAELNRRSLPIKSIILSGHDEFEYARQAIKLGASDFLLKPPDMELLLQTVLQVKQAWAEENRLKQQLQDNLPLMRYKFIQALLDGASMSKERFAEKTGVLGLSLKPAPFYLALVQVEEDPDHPKGYGYEDQQLMNFAIGNIIGETLAQWPDQYCFMKAQGSFIALVNAEAANSARLQQDLQGLVHNLRETLKYQTTVGVSFPGANPGTDLQAAYKQAKSALQYKYYTGANAVIFLDMVEWEASSAPSEGLPSRLPASLLEEFQAVFRLCNQEQLQGWITLYINHLKEADFPVDLTKTMTIQWMVEASITMTELHSQLKRDDLLTPARIAAVLSLSSLAELEKELKAYLGELLGITAELRKAGKNALVQKAKLYIKEHYRDNITLESIAREVFLSPVYLSFLFKQEEGLNLSDFITQTRLEKAKELLADPALKTYEIAEKAGYHDDKYFSRLFKKRLGMTPTEYRNSISGG